jgi:hypothetical protein
MPSDTIGFRNLHRASLYVLAAMALAVMAFRIRRGYLAKARK